MDTIAIVDDREDMRETVAKLITLDGSRGGRKLGDDALVEAGTNRWSRSGSQHNASNEPDPKGIKRCPVPGDGL